MIGLIAGRFSKGERAQQRAKINLEDVSLSPKTQQRHNKGIIKRCANFCALQKKLPQLKN